MIADDLFQMLRRLRVEGKLDLLVTNAIFIICQHRSLLVVDKGVAVRV